MRRVRGRLCRETCLVARRMLGPRSCMMAVIVVAVFGWRCQCATVKSADCICCKWFVNGSI